MKLTTKLTAICAALLVLSAALLSGMMLWQVREQGYRELSRRSEEALGKTTDDFWQALSAISSQTESGPVQDIALQYAFRSCAPVGAVLAKEGQLLYAPTAIDPRPYLTLSQDSGIQSARISSGGSHYLLLGRAMVWKDWEFEIYLLANGGYIHQELAELLGRFGLLALCVCLLGLLGVRFVLRRTLAPLSQLQKTAQHIAEGNYSQRASVNTRDEVGQLAEHFNRMAQAVDTHIQTLTEQNARQQLFIGSVTHELKTPLTSLLLNVDTLRTMYLSQEQQQTLLESMDAQLHWLEQMVRKLLKLISLEKSTNIVPASVADLLAQVTTITAGTMGKYGTTLDISCQADTLPMDLDLLSSALVNLVENSAKASQPGQKIFLRAVGAVLEVRDEGRGIAPEDLSRVTEPFYMGDPSRSKVHGGFGLGLALVKEIAAVHHARLEIESTLGQGTTVRLVFPESGNETVMPR